MRRIRLVLAIIILSLLFGAISCAPKKTQSAGQAVRNESSWPVSSPEAQGIDSGKLIEMLEDIRGQHLGVHSLQIVRNGVLVLDAYLPPFEEGERHNIYSCTKSIMSILIGIAMD